MSGTHRDLFFWSISRCFVSKNHTWRLGPMETSISDAGHPLLHAENHGRVLGTIETWNFGPKAAGFHAKTSDEGWNPYSLFILVLSTRLCVLKTTDEIWDPFRLLCLVTKSLFCMEKITDEGWNPYKLVILVQITLFYKHKTTGYVWDPETPVFVVLITLICMHKTTGEVWVPYRLVILLQKSLFCMQKPQKRAGTHRDK